MRAQTVLKSLRRLCDGVAAVDIKLYAAAFPYVAQIGSVYVRIGDGRADIKAQFTENRSGAHTYAAVNEIETIFIFPDGFVQLPVDCDKFVCLQNGVFGIGAAVESAVLIRARFPDLRARGKNAAGERQRQ